MFQVNDCVESLETGGKMRFLTNMYDPKQEDTKWHISTLPEKTLQQTWKDHEEWLKDKIIGPPQATDTMTVEELQKGNIVGVYIN